MDTPVPVNLLVLPSWYPPRGGQFFREHGTALASSGIRVNVLALNAVGLRSVFSTGSETSQFEDPATGFAEYVKPHLVLPGSGKSKVRRWVRHLVSLADNHMRDAGKPCLMQVQSSLWAGLAALEIHRKWGIPYVITEHRGRFIAGNPYAERLLLPWQASMLKEAFEEAAAVVTVSRALQERIVSIAPACKNKLFTIPNMVDTGFFVRPDKPPSGPFTFFCLAHLETGKGIDTLIQASDILGRLTDRPFRLSIGGDGPQRGQLERMSASLSLENTVSFAGALDRGTVRDMLHGSHAFVLPSRFEAFGMVYAEAMACGLPVIATSAGGPAEFVGEENGLLVQPGQAELLALAMRHMMDRYDEYKPERIRESTVRQFSKDVIATAYLRLYNRILEKT